jgi:minor extracellular serine protease Vpr
MESSRIKADMRLRAALITITALLSFLPPAWSQRRPQQYALILNDPPVAQAVTSRAQLKSAAVMARRDQINAAQTALRRELQRENFRVTGAVSTVLNAVFVTAPPGRESRLRALPGVKAVVPLRRHKLLLDRAAGLVNAPAAWSMLGGSGNAGAGRKIAIIDTGIDLTQPMFHDPTLTPPPGFPKCDVAANCAFTSEKVIVARSYVSFDAAPSDPNNPAVDSAPDDLSPRDRVGHGTAVASVAAGATAAGPLATITGIAPKAFLGNYKIFGTPGVNDGASSAGIISAINDAVDDGMDVAVLSLGGPAFFSPLATGQDCGLQDSAPCDIEAAAIENASRAGLTVIAAAGNDGNAGTNNPTLATASTPAIAPSAIAVGATTNSHQFVSTVRAPGGPPDLQQIDAVFGDGPLPPNPLSAPVRSTAQFGDADGCTPPPPNSLSGAFALVNSDNCFFSEKTTNAQLAGAVGVIMYLTDVEPLFQPGGLVNTSIPTVLISLAAGQALDQFSAAQPDALVTLDPDLRAIEVVDFNRVAGFSSRAPSAGLGAIKPEITAVGVNVYMAAEQTYAYGELYSPNGFSVADGTSFATPMVAGGVALVKQQHPDFTPAQLKSAVVNTASQDNLEADGSPAKVASTGAGRLNAGAAVSAVVTIEPSTLSFGILSAGSLPLTQTLRVTNVTDSALNLALSFQRTTPDVNARLSADPSQISLAPHQSTTVSVSLTGTLPVPGQYQGSLVLDAGSGAVAHAPYLYIVGDGIPDDAFPLTGIDFDGAVGQQIPDGFISMKVIDRYGAPVANQPVAFSVRSGGGELRNASTVTDNNGVAAADAFLGPEPGDQAFRGCVGSCSRAKLSVDFTGLARIQPVIAPGAAVNAASFEVGSGLAPGSYVSLFGVGLSDATRATRTASLPLALNDVSVSFDVPGQVSAPGRIYYVSPNQVNVQIPWELQGQTSAQIKVTVGDAFGKVYTLPLAQYSPAIFTIADSAAGAVAAAEHLGGAVVTTSNPARRGEIVQIFANGMGPVTNTPASGEPAVSDPLSMTTSTPTVTIGGRPAEVQFSGLTPGISGLYQVNVTVPADAPSGLQPVVVSIGGISSKPVMLPVQ